ncbi:MULTISPECIES: pyridoxal 5'-phosphate synthase glutaminase subunit PdxT [unclassified Kocuria]|uniref:pyridoxal 5'-phosphate synthase glutaminase subunit PdxT n=1 Tax=unclassified Kocuria TaxID=2649579 RepID=UPI0019D0DAC3|nr:pyridoxal 5'-phosphate synthase glutaminase subunit PdxT [Kocuria sp. UBA1838]
MSSAPTVGVLALQGGVAEHLAMFQSLGARAVRVRSVSDLLGDDGAPAVDALVLPGGESSTMDRLCRTFGLFEPLQRVIRAGLPTLGTCAGLIMLSMRIADPAPGQQSLGVLDVTVDRNAFGSQVDSAEVSLPWAGTAGHAETDDDTAMTPSGVVRAAFIRAPSVTEVGDGVQVLARYRDTVVAVRQANVLGISFHPELMGETTVHEELLSMVRTGANA